MFGSEKFKPANDNETVGDGAWRERAEQASSETKELLQENGVPLSVEGADLDEAHATSEQVKVLIGNVSYDEAGDVINENRFVARELGVYGNLIDKFVAYKEAPRPSFMKPEAANDDGELGEGSGTEAKS